MQLSLDDLNKSNPLEKSFETSMVKKIKQMFPDCYEIPKPIRPSTRGTPDRMFVINGKFVAIETKRAKNSKTATMQKERIKDVHKAGGFALVAKDWETVEEFLTRVGIIKKQASKE